MAEILSEIAFSAALVESAIDLFADELAEVGTVEEVPASVLARLVLVLVELVPVRALAAEPEESPLESVLTVDIVYLPRPVRPVTPIRSPRRADPRRLPAATVRQPSAGFRFARPVPWRRSEPAASAPAPRRH